MSEIKVNSVVNSTGDNDSGLDLSTNDQVIIKTANTTAVTVDSSQNVTNAGNLTVTSDLTVDTNTLKVDSTNNRVGIGTASPTTALTLGASHTATIQNGGSNSAPAYAITSGSLGTNGITAPSANTLGFVTASTERMRIVSGGNVLVGTTNQSPAEGTTVGVRIGNNGTSQFSSSGDAGLCSNRTSDNGNAIVLRRDGTIVGTISVTTSSTSYNTSSDHRLKENVVAMTDATARLKQLQPKRFNFISDADTTVDGFLAHEVSSIVPEAVFGTHNEVDDDGNPVYQGIDQSKLVPLLVKTIQELEARITALENA